MNTILTPLDICNLALSKIGEAPITALEPNNSQAAKQCYMHYHPARKELLCSHRWGFAQQQVELLSENEPSALNDSLIRHCLPTDCLRVLSVNEKRWVLRRGAIYSPNAQIKVLYTFDCEDCELFDALFVEALATLLASKICLALTSSITAKQQLMEEYRKVCLPNAAHFNAVQDSSNDSHPLYQLWKKSGLCHYDDDTL